MSFSRKFFFARIFLLPCCAYVKAISSVHASRRYLPDAKALLKHGLVPEARPFWHAASTASKGVVTYK